MTVYSDAKSARTTIRKRIKFYENVLMPPKGFHVEFFDDDERKGIRLCDDRQREVWFSEWMSKTDLLKEVDLWKSFKILSIKPMKCEIGWKLILSKRNSDRTPSKQVMENAAKNFNNA